MKDLWTLQELVDVLSPHGGPANTEEMRLFLAYYHVGLIPMLRGSFSVAKSVVGWVPIETAIKVQQIEQRRVWSAVSSRFSSIKIAAYPASSVPEIFCFRDLPPEIQHQITVEFKPRYDKLADDWYVRLQIDQGERNALFKFLISARKEARDVHLKYVLQHHYPFLSPLPQSRCFTLDRVLRMALPGVPTTRSGLHKWFRSLSVDYLDGGKSAFWGAFPTAWRRAFSVRYTNAMEAIGMRYFEPDFASMVFERLTRTPTSPDDIGTARTALVDRVLARIKSGEGRLQAIRSVVSEASSAPEDSELGKAARAANAKRRGLSERSLRRWLSGTEH